VAETLITLPRALVGGICAHARASAPEECCGLVGGRGGRALALYPLRNVAASPDTSYEAAPQELFAAQREMRGRGEELVAIYHSHPRSPEPVPSETDVRLAFYPEAVYFIVGLAGGECVLRAFRLFEGERRWEKVEYAFAGE
jgi:proteasome lid subunit RPN8/RPN11